MPIAPDFTSILSRDFTIDFTRCDPKGRLRLTDLCHLLQIVAGDHADIGGISFSDMQQHHQAWVLSRMRLEISELPVWKDTVTVKTWIVNLENSRSVRALELYRNGEKLVGCETFWAVFNTNSRRPESLALPHAHFEKFGDRHSTVERVKRIDVPSDIKLSETRKTVFSDIDIVNHVNNVKYLEWCLDCEEETFLSAKIKSVDMNFMSEVMLGESVEIWKASGENSRIFSVIRNGKSCFALEIGV